MKKASKLLIMCAITICSFVVVALTVSAATSGDYTYTISNGEATITGCNTYVTNANIPSTLEGCPVTKIDSRAFADMKNLQSVSIPDTVTEIVGYAFVNCSSLEEIILPERISSIGVGVFKGCTGLKSISIPKHINVICGNAFQNCTGLQLINYDAISCRRQNPTDAIFSGCTSVTQINIGEDVLTPIPFSECSNVNTVYYNAINGEGVNIPTSVENIVIGDNVEQIPYGAFANCKKLKSIIIPEGLQRISRYSFYRCDSLSSIQIPQSVSFIDKYAFALCDNLVIYGYSNTYVERYANENNIPFVSLGEVEPKVYTSSSMEIIENKLCFDITAAPSVSVDAIFIGLYNENNQLLDFNIIPVKKDLSNFYVVINNKENVDYAKIFVWSNLNSLTPISNAEIIHCY